MTIDKANQMALWDVSREEPRQLAKPDLANEIGNCSLRPFRTGSPRVLTFNQSSFWTWRIDANAFEPDLRNPDKGWAGYNIQDMAVSDDGRTMMSSHLNGMVRLREVSEAGISEKRPIQPQPAATYLGVRNFCCAPDGRHLALKSEDGVQVWRLGGATCESLPLKGEANPDRAPVGWLDTRQFVTTIPDVWEIAEGEVRPAQALPDELSTPIQMAENRVAVCYDYQGSLLSLWDFSASPPKRLQSWLAAPKGRKIRDGMAWALYAFSANGRMLATVDSADGTPTIIRIWDIEGSSVTPRAQGAITTPHEPIYSIALTRDGSRLGIASNGTLSLWSLAGGKPERRWEKPGYWGSVAFAPDGQQLAAESEGVSLFTTAEGEQLTHWPFPGDSPDLAFAPDGRHLLTANANGTVYVLRLKGKILRAEK